MSMGSLVMIATAHGIMPTKEEIGKLVVVTSL